LSCLWDLLLIIVVLSATHSPRAQRGEKLLGLGADGLQDRLRATLAVTER
jgi:hypothetical protein